MKEPAERRVSFIASLGVRQRKDCATASGACPESVTIHERCSGTNV